MADRVTLLYQMLETQNSLFVILTFSNQFTLNTILYQFQMYSINIF